jgi:hypothetical protein
MCADISAKSMRAREGWKVSKSWVNAQDPQFELIEQRDVNIAYERGLYLREKGSMYAVTPWL